MTFTIYPLTRDVPLLYLLFTLYPFYLSVECGFGG